MKKEQYFDSESIEGKSREMLGDVEELRKRHRMRLTVEHSALLVLDMQRYFIEKESHAFIPSAPAIIPRITKLIEVCEKTNIPVILTQHHNCEADAAMMSIWWKDLMAPENPLNGIVEELQASSRIVIQKSQYDAFYQTELEGILLGENISQLMICGVMTHLCCETTARSAFVRGFEVFLAIDGTATCNEPFHRATLWNAAHGFAVPMLIEELILECGS